MVLPLSISNDSAKQIVVSPPFMSIVVHIQREAREGGVSKSKYIFEKRSSQHIIEVSVPLCEARLMGGQQALMKINKTSDDITVCLKSTSACKAGASQMFH